MSKTPRTSSRRRATSRGTLIGIIALFLLGAATACSSSGSTPQTSASASAPQPGGSASAPQPSSTQQQPITTSSIKIGVYPGSLMSLPVFVADAEGIFAKNGLDAQLINVSSGPNMTAAVVSGSIDIDLNDISNNVVATESGKSIVAVAGNLNNNPFSVIVSNKWPVPNASKGFPDNVRDLKGAKIGVMATGGSVEQMTRYVLKQAGLDPDKDVKLVNVGLPATGIPALKAGQVDAYMAIEPAQSTAKLEGIGKVIFDLRSSELPSALSLANWPYNQWSSTPETIKKKADTIAKFQTAMKATYAYMADPANLAEIKKVAMDKISDNATLVDEMLSANLASFGFDLPQSRVQNGLDYCKTIGLMKDTITYDSYVDAGARSS